MHRDTTQTSDLIFNRFPKCVTVGAMSRNAWILGVVSVMVSTVLFASGAEAQRRGRGVAQASAGANAPTSAQTTAARTAYARGQEAFRAGDFAAAQTAFEEAFAAVPNPVVLLSVAQAQERRQDVTGMVATLERYLQLRADAPDRAAIETRISTAKAQPGSVHVTSTPSGAAVSLDGAATSSTTPVDLQVAPGEHEITVAAEGYESSTRPLSISFASRQDVDITLQAVPAQMDEDAAFSDSDDANAEADGQADDVHTEAVTTESTGERHRHAGVGVWVATGVGAAALVTGSVLGYLALNEQNDFDIHPTTAGADRTELYALMADVSFGIAAVGGITALVLWLTTPAETDEEAHARTSANMRLEVAPLVLQGGGGASVHGRF